MAYVRLGRTGLKVSRIALGCMSYGNPGFHQWTLSEEESQPFFRQAVELGTIFWDTANGYGGGSSEEFVGPAVKPFARREDIVLATRVFNKMYDGPGGSGLSRKAIVEQLEASLRRLDTDYIDLSTSTGRRGVSVEETMEVLHDVIKAGKVRYLGASSDDGGDAADPGDHVQHPDQLGAGGEVDDHRPVDHHRPTAGEALDEPGGHHDLDRRGSARTRSTRPSSPAPPRSASGGAHVGPTPDRRPAAPAPYRRRTSSR